MDTDIYCASELPSKKKKKMQIHWSTFKQSYSIKAVFGYIEYTFRNTSVLIMVLHCQQLKLALAEIIRK